MAIKYQNFQALFIHKAGNRSSGGFRYEVDAIKWFKNSPTAVKLVLFKSTHNNTRLKYHSQYGPNDK